MLNVELGLRQKSKEFLPFSFLISHLSFFKLSHFLPFSLFISHLSFVIFKSFSFFIREREGDPCIDAQQDDEQSLDGVDNQHEEQGIV